MQPTLPLIIECAKTAGAMLRKMQYQDLEIQHKGRTDLVTAADKASEVYLLGEIQRNFPSHSIIAEESGNHQGDPAHQWFVDPLDGTLNYAHGLPFYSVSIGYAHNGRLELGVVYDPSLDECFSVQCGQGTHLNGQVIRISKTNTLIDALLATGFRAALIDTSRSNFNNFLRFSRLTQGVRRFGSAALNLAYVAAGRLDGFWDVSLSQWDVAAGALLVQEAGGIVTKMYGEPEVMSEPVSILAANPVMHEMMLKELLKQRQE